MTPSNKHTPSPEKEGELRERIDALLLKHGKGSKHLRNDLMALIQAHTDAEVRTKVVELRDQWAVWLDDNAGFRQSTKQIVEWLDREIAWFDKKHPASSAATPNSPKYSQAQLDEAVAKEKARIRAIFASHLGGNPYLHLSAILQMIDTGEPYEGAQLTQKGKHERT